MTRRDMIATVVYRGAEYSHLAVLVGVAVLAAHLLNSPGFTGWPLAIVSALIGAGTAALYQTPMPLAGWSLADVVALPVGPITRWAGWTPNDDETADA